MSPATTDSSLPGLESAMAQTWPAVEQQRLGGWVLRASGGFTNRANAALTSADPGRPVEAAMDAAAAWYAERELPLRIVRTGPVGFDVRRRVDPVVEAALDRGCRAHSAAHVMVAPTARVLQRCSEVDLGPVNLATALPPRWLTAYGRSRALMPGASEEVLTGSPAQIFAWSGAPEEDGDVWAIGRLGIADGWGGLAAVWVDPARRRSGAGRLITTALVRAATQGGIRRLHLQVEVDNGAAIALYKALGFERHHDYVYLTAPQH